MIRGLLAIGAALLALPAAADWLVLRDGTRIETEGPWKVKGRQVIFTRPGGALSALRLADVDLDSSAEATSTSEAAATEPAAAQPASSPGPSRVPSRRSILTLTNDDLRPSGRSDAEGSTEPVASSEEEGESENRDREDDPGPTAPAGAAPPDGAAQPVVVSSWRDQESNAVDGLEIIGSVRNQGQDVAANIQIQVKVTDEDGGILADTQAFLERSSLAPGRTTGFRALLPGVYALLEDPTFVVASEGFTLGLVEETERDSEEDAFTGDDFTGDDEFAEPGDVLDDYDELEPADEFEEEGGGGSFRTP